MKKTDEIGKILYYLRSSLKTKMDNTAKILKFKNIPENEQ